MKKVLRAITSSIFGRHNFSSFLWIQNWWEHKFVGFRVVLMWNKKRNMCSQGNTQWRKIRLLYQRFRTIKPLVYLFITKPCQLPFCKIPVESIRNNLLNSWIKLLLCSNKTWQASKDQINMKSSGNKIPNNSRG